MKAIRWRTRARMKEKAEVWLRARTRWLNSRKSAAARHANSQVPTRSAHVQVVTTRGPQPKVYGRPDQRQDARRAIGSNGSKRGDATCAFCAEEGSTIS